MARKRFGQNFLQDPYILSQIYAVLGVRPQDTVVEIGPGHGALTEFLLTQTHSLYAIEIDRDLVHVLSKKFSSAIEQQQFTLIESDILAFDFATLPQTPLRVIGNLPYNISTPLLFKLFALLPQIQDMHFMLQKEVGLRLCAAVGSPQYGRLSVMAQYYCHTQPLLAVPPQAFDPRPKVDSVFLRLTPHASSSVSAKNISQFAQIVRTAFNYRRKTISNALAQHIDSQLLQMLEINPQARPQQLTVADYVKISNALT